MQSAFHINSPANSIQESTHEWYAIYTRFKRELLVLELLEKKGVKSYVPLKHVIKQYASKRKEYKTPLISCYVFVKIKRSDYIKILDTEYVLKFVSFANKLTAIKEEEIELMQRVIGEKLPISIEQGYFDQGDRVEIIGGNLTGMQGNLTEVNGKNSVSVALETLGMSMILDLDPKYLRKIRSTVLI